MLKMSIIIAQRWGLSFWSTHRGYAIQFLRKSMDIFGRVFNLMCHQTTERERTRTRAITNSTHFMLPAPKSAVCRKSG